MKLTTILGRTILGARLFVCLGASLPAEDDLRLSDDQPLRLPPAGSYQLRILAPSLLELALVTTKRPDPAPAAQWNFVDAKGQARLPEPGEFAVSANGHVIEIKRIGFKRRVLYAPFRQRDLRIANYLYLELSEAIGENQMVVVQNPGHDLWPATLQFSARNDRLRFSPVLHVNQTGYLPDFPKEAMIGYYLGSLGEMDVAAAGATQFQILDARSGREVFRRPLRPRPDQGFPNPCPDLSKSAVLT